jgi:hypothetical protein
MGSSNREGQSPTVLLLVTMVEARERLGIVNESGARQKPPF